MKQNSPFFIFGIWGGFKLRTRLLFVVTSLCVTLVGGVAFVLINEQQKTLMAINQMIGELTQSVQTQQSKIVEAVVETEEGTVKNLLKTKVNGIRVLMAGLAAQILSDASGAAPAGGAAAPLSETQIEALNNICRRVNVDPDIVFSYIEDADGKIITTKRNAEDSGLAEFVHGLGPSVSLEEISRMLNANDEISQDELNIMDASAKNILGKVVIFSSQTTMKRQSAEIKKSAAALSQGLEGTFQEFKESVRSQVGASIQRGKILGILVSAVALFLGAVFAFLIAGSVARSLNAAVQVLEAMANGDLTSKVQVRTKDELGKMYESLNRTIAAMSSTVKGISENSQKLSDSSMKLSTISQKMGSNASETNTQANVVSAAAEEVSKNIESVSASTDEMSVSIRSISRDASEASTVVANAVNVVNATRNTVEKLGVSSLEIDSVIKVITSIAEQTNLLALNATIEASRAGDAGKGFSVVANEVKELAKQTAKATEEIGHKISAIQTNTKEAVSAINQINVVISKISDISITIASAMEEQAATANEISRNISEIAKGGVEISQNISGVAKSAQSTSVDASNTKGAAILLEEMARQLNALVSQFKIS